MAAEDKDYVDREYRRFLKEKEKYVDFDEFCHSEGMQSLRLANIMVILSMNDKEITHGCQ